MSARVPRLAATFHAGACGDAVDRAGGLPSAWADGAPWPACGMCARPMTFALQLIGRRAGGEVDLGDACALQLFVCAGNLTGDPTVGPEHWHYCGSDHPGSGASAAVLRAQPLGAETVPAPETFAGKIAPSFRITFEPGSDDARLADDDFFEHEDWDGAYSEAAVEKVGGVPTYGNDPVAVRCPTCDAAMTFFATFREHHVVEVVGGRVFLFACPARHAVSYQSIR